MIMDQEAMQNPLLVGPRLYLRPLEPEQDSEKVAHWNNDEQMRSYFNVYPTSYTRMRERLGQFYHNFRCGKTFSSSSEIGGGTVLC